MANGNTGVVSICTTFFRVGLLTYMFRRLPVNAHPSPSQTTYYGVQWPAFAEKGCTPCLQLQNQTVADETSVWNVLRIFTWFPCSAEQECVSVFHEEPGSRICHKSRRNFQFLWCDATASEHINKKTRQDTSLQQHNSVRMSLVVSWYLIRRWIMLQFLIELNSLYHKNFEQSIKTNA